ncbi:YbbR-like protein [compost metagenome]
MGRLSEVQGTIDVSGLNDSVKGKSVKLTAYDMQGNEMTNAEVSPGSVEVDIPLNKMYKTIPIEVSQIGQLPDGYVLSGIKLDVEGVALYGSKEALEGINSYPISIDLSKSTGSTETKYMVDLTPPEGFEKIEPSSVQVSLHIELGGKRQIDGIPVTLTGESSNLTTKFTEPVNGTISLTVIGDHDVISNLTVNDIKVTASLADLTAGTHSIPVKVTLPDNVKLIDSDQSKEIVIELTETENQATTTLPEEELEPSGENEPTSNDGDHGNADLSTSGGE